MSKSQSDSPASARRATVRRSRGTGERAAAAASKPANDSALQLDLLPVPSLGPCTHVQKLCSVVLSCWLWCQMDISCWADIIAWLASKLICLASTHANSILSSAGQGLCQADTGPKQSDGPFLCAEADVTRAEAACCMKPI